MVWKILGIEQTKDEEAIKTAYRNKLRYVNPEDDEEGFKELRRAYEEALEYANQAEGLHNVENEEMTGYSGKKNEVDLWIDQIDMLYQDVKTRCNPDKWEGLLNDPICDDLDTELEAGEKLLVYFMSHAFMPQEIWKLVDERFHYIENFNHLKERFPENYLEYVKWQIENPQFIDYGLFDGKTDDHVDDFINKLYEIKNVLEEHNLKKVRQMLNELERFELTHPYTQVEEARYLLLQAEQLGKENDEESSEINDGQTVVLSAESKARQQKWRQEALDIMEELDFEYSENPYIERIYAESLLANQEIDKAKAVYDAILEKTPDNYMAMLGQANCTFLAGNPEDAKERVEDVLENRVQDMECLALLDEINRVLVKNYEKSLETSLDRDICFKLGWCYYQKKEFEKGIALLDRLGSGEDYDYINLRCRLYLASDDYEHAYPLARKWLELIEKSEDDGSREMTKRKNRLSLAHFSVGVCIWETVYKKADGEEKNAQFLEASLYIKRAISEENNILVKLSYMEQLAKFYLDAKEYEECIEICNEIIVEDKTFFPAYVHRQEANYELKNGKEVIDDYFVCQEIYPAYAPPYVLAAEVFFAFDQYDDVENIIKTAGEAGLESDSLELYRIKCIHYKEFSKENVKIALLAAEKLRNRVTNLKEEQETDLKDLAELEREYAVLYWDLDETEKTFSIIEDFLQEHPDNLTMMHLKADVLNRENNLEEALRICRKLADMEPDNLYTILKLGNCWERLGKLNRAVDCYERILQRNAEFGPALRRQMYIYSYVSTREDDLEKCKVAVQYATRFIEATGSAEGYVERGNLYIDLYELHKAVEDCEKAIELNPDAYYAYNNMGCALLKLRQIDKAIEPLKHAIAMEPDKDHLPYLNLAECYVIKKEYDKAICAYQEVLRLCPEAVRWKEEIAKILVLEKKYDKAISIYQELLDKAKQTWKEVNFTDKLEACKTRKIMTEQNRIFCLYCDLADVYRQAGDKTKAEEYYNKVSSHKTIMGMLLSPSAMAKVGEYYRDQGNLKKAEVMIKKALRYIPQNNLDTTEHHYLFWVYATILLELGEKHRSEMYAVLHLEQFTKKYGGEEKMLSDLRYRPMHLYTLAIVNICCGNLQKGRAYLEQIEECIPCVTCETCTCFEYYFGMGLIAELEGRKNEARKLYEKAIEMKGDYPCAKRHLDNI